MKNFKGILLLAIGVFASQVINAGSTILEIVPSQTSVKVSRSGQTNVLYTVTNHTNKPIDNLIITPNYHTTGYANGILLDPYKNNCKGILKMGTSCNFTINILGANQPASFLVTPRVCGYGGIFCNVPARQHILSVQVNNITITPYIDGQPFVGLNTPYTLNLNTTSSLGYKANGQWTIDWGDGNINNYPATATTASHQYLAKGLYQTISSFTDSIGNPIFVNLNYPNEIYPQDPILYYGFNGSANVGPDYIVNGNVQSVPSLNATLRNSLLFSTNSYLIIPDSFQHQSNFFGLDFWFKPLDLITSQMIYAGKGNQNGNVKVYIANNRLYFTLIGVGTKSIDLSQIITVNTWHHAAISYENSGYDPYNNAVRIYIDRWLRLNTTFDPTIAPPISVNYTGATIGAYNDGNTVSQFYSGNLDEIALLPLGIFPGSFLKRDLITTKTELPVRIRVGVGPTGVQPFIVEKPTINREIVVPLDPDPSVDNVPAIQNAIVAATGGGRIKFVDKNTGQGGGTYYLLSHSGSAFQIFTFNNLNNIEIDGNHTTLLRTSAVPLFRIFNGSNHIYIHDVTLGLDPNAYRPGVYANILSIDNNAQTVTVQFVRGANLTPDVIPASSNLWRWRSVDRITRKDLQEIGQAFAPTVAINPIDPSIWTVTLQRPPSDPVWTRLSAAQTANRLLQINNYSDGDHQFTMSNVMHLTFDHINMTGCMSDTFIAQNTFNYLQVTNSKIGLPAGQTILDAPFAGSADGFHFHDARGGHLLFQNNDIALTDDDPISLKDPLYFGQKMSDFVLSSTGAADIPIGSLIELRTAQFEELSPPFSANVIATDAVNNTITLDKPIPGAVNDSYRLLLDSYQTSNWIFRNNYFHDLYGRMMIYTDHGIFLNNRIQKMYFHIGLSDTSFDGGNFPSNIIFNNNDLFNGPADISQFGIPATAAIIPDIGYYNNSYIRVNWTVNRALNFIMMENYFEQIDSPGVIQLNNYTAAAQIFGNWLYNPITTNWVVADSTSTYQAGDNQIQNSLLQPDIS